MIDPESLFLHYDLPVGSIAQEPIEPRDAARLLVVRRATGSISHHVFGDLPQLLNPGDLVVLNTTRVLPARLAGIREQTGGHWHGLFVKLLPDGFWEMLGHAGGHIAPGEWLAVEPGPLRLQLKGRTEKGRWIVAAEPSDDAIGWLERCGQVPLPPYIRKGIARSEDIPRYQTLHARDSGSIAAPTAGLHFTPRVFEALAARGIGTAEVCLHVGPGTFQPLPRDNPMAHAVEAEWGRVPAETLAAIAACRARGGRVVAVGTTCTRLLESMEPTTELSDWEGWAKLTVRPGHEFRHVDAMITNFHQPGTGLLLLMNSFASTDLLKRAYTLAITAGYRFLSYGDATLVL